MFFGGWSLRPSKLVMMTIGPTQSILQRSAFLLTRMMGMTVMTRTWYIVPPSVPGWLVDRVRPQVIQHQLRRVMLLLCQAGPHISRSLPHQQRVCMTRSDRQPSQVAMHQGAAAELMARRVSSKRVPCLGRPRQLADRSPRDTPRSQALLHRAQGPRWHPGGVTTCSR